MYNIYILENFRKANCGKGAKQFLAAPTDVRISIIGFYGRMSESKRLKISDFLN
jgi:hypothetical protein